MGWRRRRGAVARATVAAVAEGLEGRVMLALPGGWSQQDIGTAGDPALAGSADYNSSTSTYTVVGGGSDIWDPGDHFHYAYRTVSGNCTVVGRVMTLAPVSSGTLNEWAKAGIMMRANLDPSSPHATMVITGDHGASFQRRVQTESDSAEDTPDLRAGLLNYTFVKIVRAGKQFTAYYATKANVWIQVGPTVTVMLPESTYVGFAVTSHNNGAGAVATFQDFSVEPGGPSLEAPTGLSATSLGPSAGIVLKWVDNSMNEMAYAVERSSTSATGGFTEIANNLPANSETYTDTAVVGGQHYWYRVRAFSNTTGGPYSNVADTIGGIQNGLTMQAWNNLTREGPAALTQVVPAVDFDWGWGSPGPAIQPNDFSTLFTGRVRVPETGWYTFISQTDDAGNCWIDDALVSSDPDSHGMRDAPNTTPIELVKDNWYNIRFEQEEYSGGAGARLDWVRPDGTRERIPSAFLDVGTDPLVQFASAGQNLLESSGTRAINVELSSPASQDVIVPYTVSGSAIDGLDYTITPSPITIPAGSVTGAITVTINDDTRNEPDETIVLTMGTPTNGTAGGTTVHTITVADNDPIPAVQFVSASQVASEGAGALTATIQLSFATPWVTTVPFAVSGTASNGSDYTITPSPITIPAGSTTGTATVTIVDDILNEGDETIVLTLDAPTNATLGTTKSQTITIIDNDPIPTVQFVSAGQVAFEAVGVLTATVQLSFATAWVTTVPFTMSGSATNGSDYSITPSPITIPAGSTTGTATVTIVDDILHEADETIVLTLDAPTNATWGNATQQTVTIVDNDWITATIPNVQIGSNTTQVVSGQFDIAFSMPASRGASLAGYAMQLSLSPGNAGVRLTGVGEPANAVFPGRTPGVFGTGDTLLVSDNLPGIGQANPIVNGMGLVRVFYEVQPQVKGTFQVRIDSLELYDADAEVIPGIRGVNGQLQVMDLTGPTVTGVRIGSTKWTASTFPYKDGYGIPVGSSQQIDPLPWSSPDKLSMTFSEDVTIAQNDLALRGVNTANYSFSAFNYDASTRTATWTLSSSTMNDKLRIDLSDNVKDADGNRLDGEWTDTVSAFPSGNNTVGGDFRFRMNVLRGDVNFSGNVGVDDVLYVRNQQFTVAGGPGYNAFYDINANGEIKINDVILVRNQQFTSLPVGDPLSAEQGPMPVRWEQASGLTAMVQSVSVTSAVDSMVSGYVDVVLSVPPGFSGKLAGYESSVWLSPGGSGVSLKGADVAGGAIFGLSKPLAVNITAGRMDVTDALMGVGQDVLIADGGGLFRINFEVEAGVSGTFDVSLSGLHLYDGSVKVIEVGQVVAGRITVVSAQVQPVLRGTSGADVFRIAIDAVKQKLQVWQNASPPADPTGSYPVGTFDEVEIYGEGGEDALVVDATGGDPLAGVKLSIETGTIAIDGMGKVVRVGGLDVASGATLDVGDGSLVVESGDGAAFGELIRSARGDGAWSGVGITSSAAKGNEKGMTGLGVGVGENGEVVVKYTWNGDANLDGVVNADDYFRIDSGFLTQQGGYYNGDFNYDGVVNADDYFLIDSAFIGQTGPLAEGERVEALRVFQGSRMIAGEGRRSVFGELEEVVGIFDF